MQHKAIDIHHHYVPSQLIAETQRHGQALGVEVIEDRGSYALSFDGSKPHRLQPALMDVDRRIQIMDHGQVALATQEANTNSLGYRLGGEQGENWCALYNQCMNELVQQKPERFAGMASVPLQDPVRAGRVLEQAIGQLKFRGAFIGTNVNFAQLKKVRLAILTIDIDTWPLKRAQAKGFCGKEGLEVEIIVVAGAPGVRALLGNSVGFSTASSILGAAAARRADNDPAVIGRFVTATHKGIAYHRQNRSESLKFIARELKMSDESLAAQIFDWHQSVFANGGRPSQA